MTVFPEITKSKLRQRLMSYFFAHPQASLYLREISHVLKEDAGNLSKELGRLGNSGVFISEVKGKQKYFSLNKEYPLFEELKSIVSKTIGIEASLKDIMSADAGIKTAFIYGSSAQGSETSSSDIDLLVIGRPDEGSLMDKIDALEKKIGREINYTLYSEKAFSGKIKNKGSFIINVMKRPKIILKGKPSGF
jgi:predicted nucleotidyltransferase